MVDDKEKHTGVEITLTDTYFFTFLIRRTVKSVFNVGKSSATQKGALWIGTKK